MTAKVIPISLLFFLADGVQVYLSGVIRALGVQRKAAFLSLFCFYFISIPMSVVFAFWTQWGVIGLWIGITGGVYAKAVTTVWLVITTDWVHASKLATQKQIVASTPPWKSPQRSVHDRRS